MLTLTGKLQKIKKKNQLKTETTNILQILSVQDALIQQTIMRFADCCNVFDYFIIFTSK